MRDAGEECGMRGRNAGCGRKPVSLYTEQIPKRKGRGNAQVAAGSAGLAWGTRVRPEGTSVFPEALKTVREVLNPFRLRDLA